jgi:hypothetical protein
LFVCLFATRGTSQNVPRDIPMKSAVTAIAAQQESIEFNEMELDLAGSAIADQREAMNVIE